MNKQKILLVDDDDDILSFLSRNLETTYEVFTATNGEEALEIINEKSIALVVCDIVMPRMDGFQFCEKVKSNIGSSHIPVILLTAKDTVQSKIDGLMLGADAYLEKPFLPSHLSAQIFSLLQNRSKLKEYFAKLPTTQLRSIATTKMDEQFLDEMQHVIETHIANPMLNAGFLASTLHMSRPVFYRKLKSISNLSPYEIINLTRLKKAAEMINQQTFQISEISLVVGYASPAQLSRNFKRQFGITPSEYAKTQH